MLTCSSITGWRIAFPLVFFFFIIIPAQFSLAADKDTMDGEHKKSFTTFKPYSESNALDGSDYDTVFFDDKVWVVGGDERQGIFSSKDLMNWQEVSKDKDRYILDHTLLSFADKMWFIGGGTLAGFTNDIWSSSDGIKWQKNNPKPPFGGRSEHAAVVFRDRMWVLGGQGAALEYFSDVWSSKDGQHWDLVTERAAFGERYSHTSVVFDNKIWVIGGVVGADDANEVWYSSDGIDWTMATGSPGFAAINNNYCAAAYADRMWVAAWGEKGLTLWSSSDGKSWQELMPIEPLYTDIESLEVVNNELFIVVYGAVWKLE